ncbi:MULTISPECIES: hypothetical protein [Paraburkholderia]|uniref:hypothetical protein n=1 Tax=Paraburkholderia TaxID=1822464 RepID=UPI0022534589|nr:MULTISPECIES: hypothetical protein [Paraburkholderia]MCX4165340.1 hypothetical protein [Paraburkholderia megapolitana]MDN7160832.1 hypothetical protein [Paraburkholderia sp. CHISQ3]MDQ6497879.1 hypothetical protein [Paraburkholderia megapolitana]
MFVKSFVVPFCMVRRVCRVAPVRPSFTPAACIILAATLVAIALVAMLSASQVGSELSRAMRLSWWFS